MIENTDSTDALTHLAGSIFDGSDKYITDMEAMGQRQLVNSVALPASAPWPQLRALGFVHREPVEGDELFVHATLPQGWRILPTADPMWSKIVDDRDIERVSIFYNAASYDRRASCHLVDVGAMAAQGDMYAEGPPALPDCWHVLTEDEKRSYALALHRASIEFLTREHYLTAAALVRARPHADRIQALQELLRNADPE